MAIALLLAGCGYRPTTPLTRAAFEGDTYQVRILLTAATVGYQDIQDALIAASRAGHAAVIADLTNHGAKLDQRSGVNGWIPLQHAVHKNQTESVRALLEAGADPNGADVQGHTALMMAAGYGEAEIVHYLLKRGADPARKSSNNLNALDLALTGVRDIDRWTHGNCQTNTVRVLLEHAPGLRPAREGSLPGNRCPEIEQLFQERTYINDF